MGSLVASALRFRMLLAGLAACLVIVGIASVSRMRTDAVGELQSGPVLQVQTEALGLSSQEVEQYVTVPLENNLLNGIMGVWDERSHSIPGLSTVSLYFQPGVTNLRARQLVSERLTNAFSLPNVSKPPLLIQPLSSSSRVMMVGLWSKSLSPLELSYLARWVVKPRLSGVAGVANVAIFGQRDRQLQVLVDPARLAVHGTTLSQIISTAGNAQLVSPLNYLQGSAPGTGGFLDGPNQRLDVRPVLPLGAPKNLAAVPISGASGKRALGDVANVVEGNQPLIGDAVVRGGSGLVLMVQKLPSASTDAVTAGLQRTLSQLRPALRGVSYDGTLFRPATYTSDSLHNLKLGLLIAAILGALALGAWLLCVRAASIALVSVALSLLCALLVLNALGYTFNAVLALGLLIALGLVVDDAVSFSTELVRRLRDHATDGTPVRLVVFDAAAKLRPSLVYATLIALAAAAPLFFSKGLTATFLHPLVLAFGVAVLASMLLAVTLTPALSLLLLERSRPRPRDLALRRRVTVTYRSLLKGTPVEVCVAMGVLGIAGWLALPFLHQPAPPSFKDRSLVVQWQGPLGASLGEMDRVTHRVVAQLRRLPAVSDAGAVVGRAVSADRVTDTNSGEIFVTIKPGADYGQAVGEVKQVVQGTPGMRASVGNAESNAISGVLARADDRVVARLYGPDLNQLRAQADRVSKRLKRIGGLGTPRVQVPVSEPNIEVTVDDTAALRAGVLPGDARRQASTLVSGLTVGNFFQDQAVFDVVVQGVPHVRDTASDVRNLLIDTSGGGHVRLGDIARVRINPDPLDIQHQALSRYLDLTVSPQGLSPGDARSMVQRVLSTFNFPLRYHAEVLGATPEDATSHFAFMSYALVAVLLLLLLLQAALRNWRLAALLFVLLPSSVAGGVLVSLISGQASSLGSDVGLLAVFLLAARQGMLQLTQIRMLQEREGGPLTPPLVMRAVSERFAPAFGSVVVIAAMLLPFIFIGDAPGNEMTHTAAAVMLGGLFTATLLTQFVLPALCLVFGPKGPIAPEGPDEELELPELSTSTATAF